LPPSLEFDHPAAARFFGAMRARVGSPIVCEPRHPSWFSSEAEMLMVKYAIERVAVDPAIVPEAAMPGGCHCDCYFRWHGSPRTYYSNYELPALHDLAERLLGTSRKANNVWCIFDNTAEAAALGNALTLRKMIRKQLTE
jgi:uncharacterized protein YecE (DUF72 family)